MRAQDLPPPSRFMFWCLAPFLVPSLIAFPYLVEPRGPESWIVMLGIELLGLFTLFGFYDRVRYNWCWRLVGAIIFLTYLAYLTWTIQAGQWIQAADRGTAVKALAGMFVFGYPGFMYAVFGRFTWHPEQELEFGDEAEQS